MRLREAVAILIRSQVKGFLIDYEKVCPYWIAALVGFDCAEDYFRYGFRWGVREANASHWQRPWRNARAVIAMLNDDIPF